ncbi:hypothetical protein ABKN59_008212 [Abortiporus biennis]
MSNRSSSSSQGSSSAGQRGDAQNSQQALPPFSHIDAVARGVLQPHPVATGHHPSVPSVNAPGRPETPQLGETDPSVPLHRVAGAGRKKYLCEECGKTFDRPSSLRNHINSHTGEQPFLCPYPHCGKRFSIRSNMLRHYRLHPGMENITDVPEGMSSEVRPSSSSTITFVLDPRGASTSWQPRTSTPLPGHASSYNPSSANSGANSSGYTYPMPLPPQDYSNSSSRR